MNRHDPAFFETTPTRRFERQAALQPDAIAPSCDGRTLSHAEPNRRANQIAHRLHLLGAGPEALVGRVLERSIERGVGRHGIPKVGGAHLPIDLAYPRERVEFMLSDAGARIVPSPAPHTRSCPTMRRPRFASTGTGPSSPPCPFREPCVLIRSS